MRYLIGIDDTDNLESRGTGFHARKLGEILSSQRVNVRNISRHQLLVDPRIPYTSHNSSACLDVDAFEPGFNAMMTECRHFLETTSAPGSDAGLCIATWSAATQEVQAFGESAKRVVLTIPDAHQLAQRAGIALMGLTGTGGGVIGALAAVGLRTRGNDGRVLWAKGVRELNGVCTAQDLYEQSGIESIQTLDGTLVPAHARIALSEWVRPLMRQGKAVLLVEEVKENDDYEWRVIAKEVIKQHSN